MTEPKIIDVLRSNSKFVKNNLQIIACAGSGKTEFISTRIAFLIAEKYAKPENIVAFTFTERAAKELKLRIRNRIIKLIGQQPDIGDLYVGTIHSFCYELLKEFVPGYRAYDVIDEGGRFSFISSNRDDLGYDDLKEWLEKKNFRKSFGVTEQSWIINMFIRSVDIVREEDLDVNVVSTSKAFRNAHNRYNEILIKKRFLDFSSLMYLTLKTLKYDKQILEKVSDKYRFITVDEYQDINKIQEEIINLITGKSNNLCVVGDDDQSIYQWRGSTVKNILTFEERYPNVFTHKLEKNRRSTDDIIKLSGQLIKGNNPDRHQKKIVVSNRKSDSGDIYKVRFEYQVDEIDFIVHKINELIGTEWIENDGSKRGLTYSDIAVFFRSVKYEGNPYLDAFKKAEIPVAVSGVGGLFESLEVDSIFDIFAYLGEFEKIWDHKNRESSVPNENQIFDKCFVLYIIPPKKQFVRWLSDLKKNVKERKRLLIQELYVEILFGLGFCDPVTHLEKFELRMYNLGRLSQAISDYEGTRSYCTYKDIRRFCWFIKHYAESSYDAGEGEDPTLLVNAIQAMTLHGTKGLGFPVVFMPFCVEKTPRQTSPGFMNSKKFDFERYQGSEQDERRLFYVGMTRSKKFLFITTSHDPGPRKRKKSPSVFFDEVNDKYCLTNPIKDPTKRNRLNPQVSSEGYKFPTNYSELSDFIRCEYDYKMRYIYGFNPIIVQALGYGKQVHNILNLLHKLAQETGAVPSEKDAAKILTEQFYLRYAAKGQEEHLRKSAMESVLKYLNMWRNDFSLSLMTERNFEMDIDNALVNGTIDLLKRKDKDENILEIVDFKTGKQRKLLDELTLQVQLYTVAAREALNLNVDKAFVHFLDDDEQSRVEILTTPNQLDLAMRTVGGAIEGITNRGFNRNPKSIKVCTSCDWRNICPKKKK